MTLRQRVTGILRALAGNVSRFNPVSIGVQLGRTLIALAELVTLSLTSWNNLTAEIVGRTPDMYCAGIRTASTFCLGSTEPNPIGQWVGIGICLVVISGIFPRITAWLHVWLAVSMNASLALPDGGEAVATFSTLFIAIMLVADGRVLAWRPAITVPSPRLTAVSYAAALGLCLQLAGLYYESALSKIAVSEWVDGSAMYYILRDPYFGSVGLVGEIMQWLSHSPLGTAALSWGTILTEIAIASLLIAPAPWKRYALTLVIALHLGIAVVLGLWSFGLVMIGTATVAAYRLRSPELPQEDPSTVASTIATPAPATRAARSPLLRR